VLARGRAAQLKSHMAEGYECPVFSVLDAHDVDRLLVKLRTVHGEAGRPDIAPQLRREIRAPAAPASASP
jgi:hypothetical protein